MAAASEGGFTLVELLVAMTMLAAVVGAAIALFIGAIRSQSGLSDRSQQVGLTRVYLERMVREVRQGAVVESASASQLIFRTYVGTSCSGAASTTTTLCRVTYSCASGTCTRTLANPDGTSPGSATPLIRGISNGSAVFTYSGNPTSYVGIKLTLPSEDGRGTLTLEDGASLRNATLNL